MNIRQKKKRAKNNIVKAVGSFLDTRSEQST